MLQSKLFTRTQKDAPADEVAKNAQLLIRAGFVNKEAAGVYSYLPLGLRVLRKIESIIREGMDTVDGQEVLMSSFHPKENWEKTGRWTSMDDLYKVSDSSGREVALGPTHEEIVSPLVKRFVSSYKDLPVSVYQIQNKFRMELRAKSGILRGREFLMKDMYSFHADEKDLDAYYDKVKEAYKKIYEKMGLGKHTYFTFAAGGTFSKYSHEFQTITDAGEDIIHVCEKCHIAVNEEIIESQKTCPECGGGVLVKKKGAEVGNIFKLQTKFSAPFHVSYKDADGEEKTVVMGCYGIGLGRLMGVIVEVFSDKGGIIWPKSVAPFHVHLIDLDRGKESKQLYDSLVRQGIEVLWDDRDLRAGEKFADADLIGIPLRVVVSKKSLDQGGVEVKKRTEEESQIMSPQALVEYIKES